MSNESSTDDADSSGDASDAFFVVDLECVLHKYRRWHQCFPRVKPFYGENFIHVHYTVIWQTIPGWASCLAGAHHACDTINLIEITPSQLVACANGGAR